MRAPTVPGLSGRISTLTKAKISHMLDHAEDPAETLDYAYERQLEDLQNVKNGIADVVTAKKRLQFQEEDLRQQADKLDGQAREAMSAAREDLARAALERKQLIAQEIGSLDQQVSELESEQEKLTAAEQQLQTKLEQFRSKKEVIKAQYSAAEARSSRLRSEPAPSRPRSRLESRTREGRQRGLRASPVRSHSAKPVESPGRVASVRRANGGGCGELQPAPDVVHS